MEEAPLSPPLNTETINPSERATCLTVEVEMSQLDGVDTDIEEFGVELVKENEDDKLTWFMHRSIVVKRRTLI